MFQKQGNRIVLQTKTVTRTWTPPAQAPGPQRLGASPIPRQGPANGPATPVRRSLSNAVAAPRRFLQPSKPKQVRFTKSQAPSLALAAVLTAVTVLAASTLVLKLMPAIVGFARAVDAVGSAILGLF